MTADVHLLGPCTQWKCCLEYLDNFVGDMNEWQPDFVIDLGDFAVQCSDGPTTRKLHDCQLKWLKRHWARFSQAPCPAYLVIGNHDVGWLKGGDEVIEPADLYMSDHGGEDITKAELLAVTKMPGCYYSFDVKGCHFIVLEGHTPPGPTAVAPGHDGVIGGYWIDDRQRSWLAQDLSANRRKDKIVFCHEELHHTPIEGSGEGGDVPYPPVGKQGSYVDNGWEIRDMLSKDGNALAVFAGHKHEDRWVVYGGVNYITLTATHVEGSYSKVTIRDGQLEIERLGQQRSYALSKKAKAI